MKSRKAMLGISLIRLVLAALLVGLPLGAYALTLHSPDQVPIHSQSIAREARSVPVLPSTPVPTATPHVPVPQNQVRAVESRLALLVRRQSPRAALAALTHLMDTNPGVLRSCHAIAHSIGHAAYARFHDFGTAVQYQDDICGSGYLHGVIESRFAAVKDIYAEMRTICSAYTAISQAGFCLHGVGHGLMRVTRNDVPRSAQLCDSYSLTLYKIRCSEGVFMENFGTDLAVHFSRFLRSRDPSYPCPEQPEFFKGSCYFYAPLFYLNLHNERYVDALNWCLTVESAYVETCTTGTGSRIMKQNVRRPRFVEHLCQRERGRLVAACIAGMVSYYLVNFNSYRRGAELCPQLEAVDQPACNAALLERRGIFPP